jgi:hypothetical protein
MTSIPTLGVLLGEQANGPLAGWPIVADGQGGTVLASPTGTSYHRGETSSLDSAGCWAAVDAFYASDLYRVFRAGYDAKRAAERAALLADFNRRQLLGDRAPRARVTRRLEPNGRGALVTRRLTPVERTAYLAEEVDG